MRITLCVITLNEEANLRRCLSSASEVVEEILIVDSGSTDRTAEIAGEFGARWVSIPWEGYVRQKNHLIRLAATPWILLLDADEALSPELRREILELREVGFGANSGCVGFSMPRCVNYEGRWIRRGDWYPDRLIRLFSREHAHFEGGRVHERLVVPGQILRLSGEIQHYSYIDRNDHLNRCVKYAGLRARDMYEAGRRVWALTPILRSAFRFVRGYLLRGGFLDGEKGLWIAWMSAYEVFLKYRMLIEMSVR
jgi:glycosyltransferase involved in cell wall biosynthesis